MHFISLRTVFFASLFIWQFAAGQHYTSINYTEKEGLPSATVYDITQDKDGFIWFGTENGLSRFDGTNFKNYTTKNGLPDNAILKVHGADNGRVYFMPFTHPLYYIINDTIKKFPTSEKQRKNTSKISKFIWKKDFLAGLTNKETYIIKDDSLFSIDDFLPGIAKEIQIAFVHESFITGSASDSLYTIEKDGNWNVKYNHYKNKNYVLNKYGKFVFVPVGNTYALDISNFLTDDLMYVYKDNFLHLFNTTTELFENKIYIEKFSSAFIDSEGSLWVTTLGNGVFRFPSFNFKNLTTSKQSEIYSIAKWDNQIIAGADYSRIYYLNKKKGTDLVTKTSLEQYLARSENPIERITKRNRVYSLYADRSSLYIGTDGFLLKKTINDKDIFKPIFPIKDIDLEQGDLLVSTGRAVLLLEPNEMKTKDTILHQRAICGVIYNSNYYIGTFGGLVRINAKTRKKTNLFETWPELSGKIISLKKGFYGDLWIVTGGNGLLRFREDKIIGKYNEDNGITSDICTSLFIDSSQLWLGTNKGLNKINYTNPDKEIVRITAANGLLSDFVTSIYVKDEDVYVGTNLGLALFKKSFLTEKSINLLHILGVSQNGVIQKKSSDYSFPSHVLNIQIEFTAISFKSAGDINYYYKLRGLDDEWNQTTNNFVNYPTLPPGDYTFLVYAKNKFGLISDTKSVTLTITPPWWATTIFRIIMISVSGCLIFLYYKWRINRYKARQKEKRDIEAKYAELEQQALLAQMNPHFIFNCLNSIQSFVISHDVLGANQYISAFSSLIRQTLENSSFAFIPLSAEVKYLETYLLLEQLRFKDKFTFSISIDNEIETGTVYLPNMLLQPYVENAIRHGINHRNDSNGKITIEVRKVSNYYEYLIEDNGVGRKIAEQLKSKNHIEYQSKGTGISANRISSINSQYKTNIFVSIDDITEKEIVKGTSVRLIIPDFNFAINDKGGYYR